MATVKVFSPFGIKELKCFDTLDDIDFIEDDTEEITDDGELTIGNPL